MNSCPKEFTLIRHLTGDAMAQTEQSRVAGHIRECPPCRQRIHLLSSELAFRQALMESQMPRLLQGARERSSCSCTRPMKFLGLAAAACLLLILAVFGMPGSPDMNDIAAKGAIGVELWGKENNVVFKVDAEKPVRQNTALRLLIHTPSAGYVTIFTVDSNLTLSPLYPLCPKPRHCDPEKIDSRGTHPMPGSFVLDDTPGPEILYIYFAERAFDCYEVQHAVRDYQQRHFIGKSEEIDSGLPGDLTAIPILRVPQTPHRP